MTDPSDIVERLRKHRAMGGCYEAEQAMEEAAAEIERLRAALAEQKEACARVADEFGKEARRRVEKADTHWSLYTASGGISAANSIAAAIRDGGR